MKNKKGNTAVIAVIIVIVAITAGVIGYLFAKKTQEPVQQQVAMQPTIPVTQTNPTVSLSQPVVDPNQAYENWIKANNQGKDIEGVDVQTFQVISGSDFAKDKNNVYFPSYISQGDVKFDAQTFEILSETYLKDKNQIVALFMAGGESDLNQLVKVDINTFQALGGAFGKDKDHVYYDNLSVDSADTETFKLTNSTTGSNVNGNGQDKNNSYECSQSDVCGAGCIITNLKTGKKFTDYFGKPAQPGC